MRTHIEVTALSLRQWDWLQTELRTSYEFAPWDVRACVEFELNEDIDVRHIEMPLTAFTGLMTVLESIDAPNPGAQEMSRLAAAVLTPGAEPCSHGAAVIRETPSMFQGAQPVRDYADGCQCYGPYQRDEDDKNTRPEGADQ